MVSEEAKNLIDRTSARVGTRRQARFDRFVESVEETNGPATPDQERWLRKFSWIMSQLVSEGWTEEDILKFIRALPAEHFDEGGPAIPSLPLDTLDPRWETIDG